MGDFRLEAAEDEYKNEMAQLIANGAAALVAARDCSREEAIDRVAQYYYYLKEAENDPTKTIEYSDEAQFPHPSKKTPTKKQIEAIALELIELAEDAVDVYQL